MHLPEAPCSTNAYVEIAGHKHQITGRGLTPADMASNYFASIDALQGEYDRRAAPPSLPQRIATVLACWLAKAQKEGRWEVIGELGAAMAMVLAGRVRSVTSTPQLYEAWDMNGALHAHVSKVDGCDWCHIYQMQHTCRHVLAVELALRCDGLAEASLETALGKDDPTVSTEHSDAAYVTAQEHEDIDF